jgi:hypothetical protein
MQRSSTARSRWALPSQVASLIALLIAAWVIGPVPPPPAYTQDVAYKCIPLEYVPFGPPTGHPHVTGTGVERGMLGLYASVPPEGVFLAGRPIEVSLVASNGGNAPVAFSFPTAQRYDVIIWDDDCKEIWRWSAGRMFAQVVQSMSVPAHGSVTYRILWDQHDQSRHQVRMGAYEAQVLFLGRGPLGSAPVVLPPLKFAIR